MNKFIVEPYRLFFPLGTIFFLSGILLWLPLIFIPDSYPVVLHRTLMLNGFSGCFIGGFLMTAIPKFSQTFPAKLWEILCFFILTVLALFFSFENNEFLSFIFSSLQPVMIFIFLGQRIIHRKQNPPYSFVFVFIGLMFWILSGLGSAFIDPEVFKRLHYEASISSIILGVGGRLIPGILGFTEIVNTQRMIYERPVSLYKTVPVPFFLTILAFVLSYFLQEEIGNILRSLVVTYVAFGMWQIYQFPKERTALTWSLWISAWLFLLSFILRTILLDGGIHVSHSIFINGIALMSFLIATRVLQSHGPKDKKLENKKVLYAFTALVVLAAATRVSAYYMPEHYLRHLGYSSLILALAVIIWSINYLRFALRF